MATTVIAASGRRKARGRARASPDSATHVRAEGATGNRVVTVSVKGIVPAVRRADSAAADVPQGTVGALAAAGVGRNEAARSPSPYDGFFG